MKHRILTVGVVALTAWWIAPASAVDGQLARGRALFDAKCAVCHGATGDGRGPATYLLSPKPRDLTSGIFKLKSSEVGSIPTDNDLFRTLTHGIPGTAMPSWASLPDTDRWALVAFVKSLSPRFTEEVPEEVMTVGPEPLADAASVARGKVMYGRLQCAECHGNQGFGDGPSATRLKDDWGYPVRPFNFAAGYKMRGGGGAIDIYRTFVMGLETSPMPAYGTLVSEGEAWDLVHYVQTLGVRPAPFTPKDGAEIVVDVVDAELPLDPTDNLWADATVVAIPVRTLWTRDQAPDWVLVRALTNGRDIAIGIEWEDALVNDSVLRAQDFRDGVAIQFPLAPVTTPDAEPFYGMGEGERAVNIWHWKADWQADLSGFTDVGAQYPGLVNDYYPLDTTERQTYSTGWASGNLMSSRNRTTAVEDLNATGQGSLTSQPADDQNVEGRGVWAYGTWRVVFRRSRTSKSKLDVQFPKKGSGDGLRMAVAVWDGEAGDRDGQKIVSEWHPISETGVLHARR